MTCYTCDADDWHKVPGLHSQSLIQICKKCGNLCHEVATDRQQKMADYYRKEYRKTVTSTNLISGENKLQYIRMFLEDHLKGKKNLLIGDVGAATGYVLNEMKQRGHRVTGCEYTTNYRRFSEHFYGIPLTEELTPKHKYDLIIMYHVLEHIPEPDKLLAKYRGMLAENGCMFISTPYWLSYLETQDGTGFFSQGPTSQHAFDHVFHKDHINLFSLVSLPNLFKKVGLTVIKDNSTCYGQSYLVKAGNTAEIYPEDWQTVLETLARQKQALELHSIGKYNEAVKAWPDFPEAHCMLIFRTYGKDPDRQADMLAQLPKHLREHQLVLNNEFRWLKQYGRLDEALEVGSKIMSIRPNVAVIDGAAEIKGLQGKYKEAAHLYSQLARMHPYKWQDCYDNICRDLSNLPAWDEEATRVAKETIFKKALEEGQVKFAAPEPVANPVPVQPEIKNEGGTVADKANG